MSFILDALRKADARRGGADTPDVPSLPAAASVASPSPLVPRVAIGAGVLLAGVVATSIWFGRSPVQEPMPADATGVPVTAISMPAEPTSRPDPLRPVPRDPDVRPLDREAAVANVAVRGEPVARAGAPASRDPATTPERNATTVTPGRVVYSDEPLDAAVTAPRPAPASDSARPPAPRGDDLMMYSEFAVKRRSGAPPLRLDIHVYSDDPASRFVFVNMRKYREGDRVDGDILVDRITPDGAVLRLRGQRFLLPRT